MAEKRKSANKLRPLEGEVQQFAVLGEMTGLLQRVRNNKSKRTAAVLSKSGPFRLSVIAFDQGGQLEDQSVEGPFTVQCLLGRVVLSIGGREHRLTTGDVLVAEAAVRHDIAAEEASVLLLTVAVAEA
jgi:quercetin dioxygenase-like cupin family protein